MKIGSFESSQLSLKRKQNKIKESYDYFLQNIDQPWVLEKFFVRFPDVPRDAYFRSSFGTITLQNDSFIFYCFDLVLNTVSDVYYFNQAKKRLVHQKWKFWEEDIIPPIIINENSKRSPNWIPPDVLFVLFNAFPSSDLLSCRLVCKAWRDISNNPLIWKPRLEAIGYYNENTLKSFLRINFDINYPKTLIHMARAWLHKQLPEYYDDLCDSLEYNVAEEGRYRVLCLAELLYVKYHVGIPYERIAGSESKIRVIIRHDGEKYGVLWIKFKTGALQCWAAPKFKEGSQGSKNWLLKSMLEFSDNKSARKPEIIIKETKEEEEEELF